MIIRKYAAIVASMCLIGASSAATAQSSSTAVQGLIVATAQAEMQGSSDREDQRNGMMGDRGRLAGILFALAVIAIVIFVSDDDDSSSDDDGSTGAPISA